VENIRSRRSGLIKDNVTDCRKKGKAKYYLNTAEQNVM